MEHYKLTQYGFEWGGVTVSRICSDKKAGWVYLSVKGKRQNQEVEIYVTKSGKVRVYRETKQGKKELT